MDAGASIVKGLLLKRLALCLCEFRSSATFTLEMPMAGMEHVTGGEAAMRLTNPDHAGSVVGFGKDTSVVVEEPRRADGCAKGEPGMFKVPGSFVSFL